MTFATRRVSRDEEDEIKVLLKPAAISRKIAR